MTHLLQTIRMLHFSNSLIVAKGFSEAATLFNPAANHLTQSAGPILIATLWQGLSLAILVTVCLRVAPGTTATLRFTLWTTALLILCLLPLMAIAPAPSSHASVHLDARWSLAVAALWLTLSLVRAADLARHALRLRSLSRQATPVTVAPGLAGPLRTHRKAQLCTTTQLDRPGVIGFFRPRILIPAWLFGQLNTPELEQIVLHELEHLRRRDDWLNLLQKMALVAFPLNPALYWIERRLCLERELACDEGVVRRTRAPRLYATCLARLAEKDLDHRALTLALGFLERQSELTRRVHGVLHTTRTLSKRQSLALTGTIAALLLGGSAELARCPQLVSFAASPVALATNPDDLRLAPETWALHPAAMPIPYTNAATPHLLRASLKQISRPRRRPKTHTPGIVLPVERTLLTQIALPVELTDTDFIRPNVPTPTTPALVRYTLIHVEGGWLLIQL